ncbi:M48 family metallopeptidase [Rossellomorea vietnamensis]|uniref:M48 family metallopeptidase n=1 Tax=Rossellomorea vietnamensis TaxID=218284 RepID=A0A5D4MJS5_9BACI|nr:M48 family metallopeptidase [Rossellomorea vietnamensis]
MVPREVIDYAAVQEICHMPPLIYDRSFWRLVGKMVQDYKKKTG